MNIRTRFFQEEELYSYLEDISKEDGYVNLKAALPYMKKQHEGQYRKKNMFSDDKIPYINHPLTMACQACSLGIKDDEILSAILLHDVVEDTGVKSTDMPVVSSIQEIVELLSFSMQPGLNKKESKRLYYEKIAGNSKAALIKMIDRCNNVSTMAGSFSLERMTEYIEETQDYIIPLGKVVVVNHPELETAVWTINYHIFSVIETIKCLMERNKK